MQIGFDRNTVVFMPEEEEAKKSKENGEIEDAFEKEQMMPFEVPKEQDYPVQHGERGQEPVKV